MNYRKLGNTGMNISEISFGAWAIGGTWGKVDDSVSMKALEAAIDGGINFFDPADVYGDGRSERLLAKLRNSVKNDIYIATKAGRRLDPHIASGYTVENITAFVERSLKNLATERIDLLQIHCPPSEVFDNEAFFDGLNRLITDGKIAHLGVSVEKVDEALRAIQYDHVKTVQIIFNMFRHKPAEDFFKKAEEKNIGIITRVPLASGMLTGKMTKNTHFEKDDHRSFNRNGEAFDKGETFSGVPYDIGLEAVEALKEVMPEGMTMPQFALAWILQHPQVSCAIPGGKTSEQVSQNIASSGIVLSDEVMKKVESVYDQYIKEHVHHLW